MGGTCLRVVAGYPTMFSSPEGDAVEDSEHEGFVSIDYEYATKGRRISPLAGIALGLSDVEIPSWTLALPPSGLPNNPLNIYKERKHTHTDMQVLTLHEGWNPVPHNRCFEAVRRERGHFHNPFKTFSKGASLPM